MPTLRPRRTFAPLLALTRKCFGWASAAARATQFDRGDDGGTDGIAAPARIDRGVAGDRSGPWICRQTPICQPIASSCASGWDRGRSTGSRSKPSDTRLIAWPRPHRAADRELARNHAGTQQLAAGVVRGVLVVDRAVDCARLGEQGVNRDFAIRAVGPFAAALEVFAQVGKPTVPCATITSGVAPSRGECHQPGRSRLIGGAAMVRRPAGRGRAGLTNAAQPEGHDAWRSVSNIDSVYGNVKHPEIPYAILSRPHDLKRAMLGSPPQRIAVVSIYGAGEIEKLQTCS